MVEAGDPEHETSGSEVYEEEVSSDDLSSTIDTTTGTVPTGVIEVRDGLTVQFVPW